MTAKLENDIINVYNEKNILIGGIKTQSNFKNAKIKIGEKIFQLSRNKWETEISENDKVIYHLKTNSFSGNTKIKETEYEITGVFGLKWGTKMMDKENNTLLKIRNENQFANPNKYEIEISNDRVSNLEVLTTFYGHLYGSNIKLKAVIIGGITAGIISSGIMN
jgi:glutamine cyclotransferase